MSKTYGAISHLIVPSPFITISGGPRICVQNLHKQITRALTSSRNSLCWWYSMGIRNVERWWWWSVGVPNGVYCVTLPLSVASANFSTFSLDGFFLFALTTNWCLNLCKCNYIITSILPVKCVAPFCEWVCVCVCMWSTWRKITLWLDGFYPVFDIEIFWKLRETPARARLSTFIIKNSLADIN